MTVKTAISLDQDLYARVDACAREGGLTRSGWIARAIEEKLERDRILKHRERMDRAWAEPLDAEELANLEGDLALSVETIEQFDR